MKKSLLSALVVFVFSCQNQPTTDNAKNLKNVMPSSTPVAITIPNPIQNNQKPDMTPSQKSDKENIVKTVAGFKLSSPDFTDGGTYPQKYTCDGTSDSPALSWANPPAGTTSYAITMHHIPAPDDEHVYMLVYDIPVNVISIASNEKTLGKWGINTVNGKPEYTPPCSKGPGPKLYTITLYALSESPKLDSSIPITKDMLISAIKDKTLGTSAINVTYSRG